MEGIIIYKSKYGATKKYADWLSDKTGFEKVEVDKAKIEDIKNYDTIIIGGGIYASGIAGLNFLRKNIDSLKEKNVIIFCVGASPYDETAIQEIVKQNLKGELDGIPCIYCRGAWDLAGMNIVDRNLCKLLIKIVSKKDPEEYETWERALMTAGNNKSDWTDEKYLEPILKLL